MLCVAALPLAFASCGDDDDNGGTAEDPISAADPEGTVTVNIRNGYGSYAELQGVLWFAPDDICRLYIDDVNNFELNWGRGAVGAAIVSVGEVGGLAAIKSRPTTGWKEKLAVIPGNGYIVENYGGKAQGGKVARARIYVVDYVKDGSGKIIGATIKYQSPFEPIINKP